MKKSLNILHHNLSIKGIFNNYLNINFNYFLSLKNNYFRIISNKSISNKEIQNTINYLLVNYDCKLINIISKYNPFNDCFDYEYYLIFNK